MLVVLLRHAKAEEHGTRRDHGRRLTDEGVVQARRAARWCAAQRVVPALLLTSPLVRAVQTAEAFRGECPGVKMRVVDWLALGQAAAGIWDGLAEEVGGRCDDDRLVVGLVGHEPDFSRIVGGFTGIPSARIKVGKASLIGIRCERIESGAGRLVFVVPSKLQGLGDREDEGC